MGGSTRQPAWVERGDHGSESHRRGRFVSPSSPMGHYGLASFLVLWGVCVGAWVSGARVRPAPGGEASPGAGGVALARTARGVDNDQDRARQPWVQAPLGHLPLPRPRESKTMQHARITLVCLAIVLSARPARRPPSGNRFETKSKPRRQSKPWKKPETPDGANSSTPRTPSTPNEKNSSPISRNNSNSAGASGRCSPSDGR